MNFFKYVNEDSSKLSQLIAFFGEVERGAATIAHCFGAQNEDLLLDKYLVGKRFKQSLKYSYTILSYNW